MIIVIANGKGGTGKSCLSQNLAVGLKMRGKKVMLVDIDPQRTSAKWATTRRENESINDELDIPCIMLEGKVNKDLIRLKDEGYFVVVDCGGHDSKAMRYAIGVADQVLIPSQPTTTDLEVLEEFAEAVEDSLVMNEDCKVNGVITRCPTQQNSQKRIDDSKAYFKHYEIDCLESVIFNRVIYSDSSSYGMAVFEHEANSSKNKAINEINNIIEEIL